MILPGRPTSKSFPRIFLLLILAAIPVSGQRLIPGSKPQPATLSGYLQAYCSTLSGGVRVCKARRDEAGESDYLIVTGDTISNRISAPAWSTASTSPDGFFAYKGDLDKNRSHEIVLVSLEGVGNGMAVSYYTAYIFDGASVREGGSPISFPIQEFGERENFVFDRKTRQTNILISYWTSYETLDPKRIPGNYLVGKWFRYKDGRLQPIFERPTMARRFLYSFAAERAANLDGRPYKWLRDPRSHRFFREPNELAKNISTRSATISAYYEDDALELLTDDGENLRAEFRGGHLGVTKDASILKIRHFGLWEQKYTYPISRPFTFPSSAFFDRLTGRKVRLETFRSSHDGDYTNVWL